MATPEIKLKLFWHKQKSNRHRIRIKPLPTGGKANKCIKSIEVAEGELPMAMAMGLWVVGCGLFGCVGGKSPASGIGKPEIKSDKSKLDVCASAVNTYRNWNTRAKRHQSKPNQTEANSKWKWKWKRHARVAIRSWNKQLDRAAMPKL